MHRFYTIECIYKLKFWLFTYIVFFLYFCLVHIATFTFVEWVGHSSTIQTIPPNNSHQINYLFKIPFQQLYSGMIKQHEWALQSKEGNTLFNSQHWLINYGWNIHFEILSVHLETAGGRVPGDALLRQHSLLLYLEI